MPIWITGGFFPRLGLERYMHLVRGPMDPKRLTGKDRQGAPAAWRGALNADTKPEWRRRIVALLEDGEERTFNAIVLECSGLEYTADVAFEKAPDLALWELVAEGIIEHTIAGEPVYFRPVKP